MSIKESLPRTYCVSLTSLILLLWLLLLCLLPSFMQLSDLLLPNPTVYRHLVGKLNYLTHTRPNLSFVVLKISQFMQSPQFFHYIAAIRVLRYLQIDLGQGILFNSAPSLKLIAFCDANWSSCPKNKTLYQWILHFFWWIPCLMEIEKIGFSFFCLQQSSKANLAHQAV